MKTIAISLAALVAAATVLPSVAEARPGRGYRKAYPAQAYRYRGYRRGNAAAGAAVAGIAGALIGGALAASSRPRYYYEPAPVYGYPAYGYGYAPRGYGYGGYADPYYDGY